MKSIRLIALLFLLIAGILSGQPIAKAQDGSSDEGIPDQVTKRLPPKKPDLLKGADPVMNRYYRKGSDPYGDGASMQPKFGTGESYSPLNSAVSGQDQEKGEGTLYLNTGGRGDSFVAAPSNAASVYENPQAVTEMNRVQKSPLFLKASTGKYVNPVYIDATDLVYSVSHGKLDVVNNARSATVDSNRGEGAVEGIDTYMGCIADNAMLGQDVAQMLCSNDSKIFTGNPPPNTKVGMDFTNNRNSPLNGANPSAPKQGANANMLRFSEIIFAQEISNLKEAAKVGGANKEDIEKAAEQLEIGFREDLRTLLGDAFLVMETKPGGVFNIKTNFEPPLQPYETIIFSRHNDAFNRMLWLLQQRCIYANSRSLGTYQPFKEWPLTIPFTGGYTVNIPIPEGFYSPGVGKALYDQIREQFGYLSLNQTFQFNQELLEVMFQLFEAESTRTADPSNGDASSSGGGTTRGTASKYNCEVLDYEKDENGLTKLLKKIRENGPTFISDRSKVSGRLTEVVAHAQVLEAIMLLQERLKQNATSAKVNDQQRNALHGAVDTLVRRAARLRSDETLEGRYSNIMKNLSELLMTIVQLSQNDKGKSGQYFGHLMNGRESGSESALTGR